MQSPAIGHRLFDRVDSLGRRRVGLPSCFCATSIPIQAHSVPRLPRDFYFHFRVIKPESCRSGAGLTPLSRSFP